MNDIDRRLQRLLDSAAQAPEPSDTTLPFGFETRVLALWRDADQPSMTPFWNRAVVVCVAVAILSVVFSYGSWSPSPANTEVALADSAIEMSLP